MEPRSAVTLSADVVGYARLMGDGMKTALACAVETVAEDAKTMSKRGVEEMDDPERPVRARAIAAAG